MTEGVSVLISRGQAAVEALQGQTGAAATTAADAFGQLLVIRELLELSGLKQYDRVLQVRVCATCVLRVCRNRGQQCSVEGGCL
jgi:hypothetical protein